MDESFDLGLPPIPERILPKPKKVLNLLENLILSRRSFKVNNSRADSYYKLSRRDEDDYLQDYEIPLGSNDSIHYYGEATGGTADRVISEYINFLFPDEHKKHKYDRPIFGGSEYAFAPGKTVVDLGSGRAIGLMQFSQKYPNTYFIGFDVLYQEARAIFPKKEGVQLSWGNWDDLSALKDESADTILSLQGKTLWGIKELKFIPEEEDFDSTNWEKSLDEYYRVLKHGGVVRFDTHVISNYKYLIKGIDPDKWDSYLDEYILILRKK